MKLPKNLFVRVEKDRDESYLLAYDNQIDAVTEEFENIGYYKLISAPKVRRAQTVEFAPSGRKKTPTKR